MPSGLTKKDIEFLIDEGCVGVISGVVFVTTQAAGRRASTICSSDQTQFELSPTWEVLVERFLRAFGEFRSRVDAPISTSGMPPGLHPDGRQSPRQLCELRVGLVLVKRFQRRSPNQGCLLAAFEESGWPEGIEDPLPPAGKGSPVLRWHHTLLLAE